VLDPRRQGTATERAAYLADLEARYVDVETVMNQLCALPSWDDRGQAWIDDQLRLATAVVYQVGTLRGEYDDARAWGDAALSLGAAGTPLRRADLMLHLSELHRVTGRAAHATMLVESAVALLDLPGLSPDDIDALAPVSCHAFLGLGTAAYWDGRPADAAPLLAHASTHGGDSIPHVWSMVNHALLLADGGDLDKALALEDAAAQMAERLGDQVALTAIQNNRACTLRRLGRPEEAYDVFAELLPGVLVDDIPDAVVTCTEDFACVLFDLGQDEDGALLMGAADAERDSTGVPRMAFQEASLAPSMTAAQARLGDAWEPLLARGAELGVLAAVASALRPT